MSFYSELKRRNVLRVAIGYLAGSWLLIQILETFYPIYGLAETSIQIVVTILAIGFIPVLVLSWVFEFTPEGLKRDKEVDRSAPATPESGKTFDRIIIVVLVLALAFFAYDKFVLDPARDAETIQTETERARSEALFESYGDKSIVVLPFANMSADPDQEFFSDGITEELLNLLAKINDLRVISRTSAFYFKDKDVDLTTIAERLRVDHVLEGSVRKAGNRVRITAQLIDARTDTHLWSETYDRELDDVFAIQDEISAHVVEQLKITMLGDLPQAEEIDADAYSRYLQAKHIAHTGQHERLELAEQLLEEVLEIEPEYVPALDALSLVYFSYDEKFPSEDDRRQAMRDLSARVSAAEPGGVADLRFRAWTTNYYDNDPATAAPLFEQALALDPGNLQTLQVLPSFLRRIGRIEEATATAEFVALRDPACWLCQMSVSLNYRTAGEYDRAIEILEDAIAWSPDRQGLYWALGSVLLQAGRPEEALVTYEQGLGDTDQRSYARIFALHDLGRLQEYEDEFAKFRSNSEMGSESIARIYAWIGNNDLALEWLEKMVAQDGPVSLARILDGGFYSKLAYDPRFDALLRKYGQHPDQREVIRFKFTPPGSKPDEH